MFQLTKEIVDTWSSLPDDACISGAELCKATGIQPNQLGGFVRSGYLPASTCIVHKSRFGEYKQPYRKIWRLRDLRNWVKYPEDRLTHRDRQKLHAMTKV